MAQQNPLHTQPSGSQTGLSTAMAELGQTASSAAPAGDVDMQSAEASADSASSPIIQQVSPFEAMRKLVEIALWHSCRHWHSPSTGTTSYWH